jgi:hypothetical protein
MIAEARALKEAFRSIYRSPNRAEAQGRLDHFLAAVERAQLPAFAAFADGVRLWRAEQLATSTSRRPTLRRGRSQQVQDDQRRAYGLPRFDGFRDGVLPACA